jgi:hypothetical protein
MKIRGVVHIHSIFSFDGKLNYKRIKDFLKNKGLSFAFITEHIENLTNEDIGEIITQCKDNSDDEFLFIPGIEMDSTGCLFLNIKNNNINLQNSQTTFNSLKKSSEFLVYSHPMKTGYNIPSWIEDCNFLEVWNTQYDGSYFIRKKNQKLLKKFQDIKKDVKPIVGLDFHDYNGFYNLFLEFDVENLNDILKKTKLGEYKIIINNKNIKSISSLKKIYLHIRIIIFDILISINRWLSKHNIIIPLKIKKIIKKWL